MIQKFKKGQRVKIIKKLPEYMKHFTANGEAIIVGSYADIFGGNSERIEVDENGCITLPYISYCLLLLKNNEGYDQQSWYPGSVLKLMDENTKIGVKLLKKYEKRFNKV